MKDFMKKKKKIIVIAAATGCILLVGLRFLSGKKTDEVINYQLVEVRPLEPLSLKGTISDNGSSSYYLNQSKGELDKILVKNGQKVNAGDVLEAVFIDISKPS